MFIGLRFKPQFIFPPIDLDPSTFMSLNSTRRLGPKGRVKNMTYAVDVVVVVWGYAIYWCTIEHY